LANGQDQITAQYSGDSNYSGSTSTAITVSVGVPGINLSSSTGTINIPAPGQSGTPLPVITVSAANGFTGAVTLSCAVTSSPSGAVSPPTCSFGMPGQNFTAPNIITLSSANTSGNATMTVASTAAKGVVFKPASRPQGPNLFLVSEVGAFIACFFLLRISAQKRRNFVLLAMAFFAILALGTGCGNSNSGSTSIPATTAGAYTVTVTATPAGATAQTTAITVNVQ
jgi:trimeric autotransporter adhesin